MIILYQGERANIICKEEDIQNGNDTIYAMFKNRLYEWGKLEELLMKVIAEQSVEEIVKTVSPKLEQKIIEKFGVLPQIHEVKTPAGTHEIKGTVHERFDDVLNLVNMDIPVFLTGAAGNTVGTGADIEYTGRFQLDASSLDRFALVEVDYSPAIENAVTNGNKELCEFARKFREITNNSGTRCLCTYRALDRISKLEKVFKLSDVLKMSLTKGLNVDDLKIIVKAFGNVTNKYLEALKNLT